ncbi:MAG TPA: TonB family protein [Hyphomicrobium sp.]|nr:TonB family protein [Hyphomicrobium sp.]
MADIETVASKLAAEKELAGASVAAGEPTPPVATAMAKPDAKPDAGDSAPAPAKAGEAKTDETKSAGPERPSGNGARSNNTAADDTTAKSGASSPSAPPAERSQGDAGLIGAVDADQRIRTSAERGERTLWMSAVFVTFLYAAMIAAQVMDIGGFSALEQELAQQQRERERRGQGGDTISVELVPDPDLNSKTEKWREGANQPPNPAPPQPQQTAALPQPPVEQPQPAEQPTEQPSEKPDETAEQEPDKQEEKEQDKEPEKDERKEAGEPTLPSLEALLDAAAEDLSEQVRAHYDRKPQRRRPQQQAMYSGGGMQVRGTGAGGKSDEFSKSVIDALMKTRPGPVALWGRVLVSFQITQQGDLLYVRVLQSSGNRAMDDAAVNAIHRAKFVKPPPGLSPEARTYIIDYIFG